VIDAGKGEVRLTSAGHLPPLLIGPEGSRYLEGEVGLPVGVDWEPTYTAHTMSVPPGGTLLAFTDGLVERRGEDIDLGLERLRRQVDGGGESLDEMLDRVLDGMRHGDTVDDTAIAGVRWLK
jgi:serine phosphatase RsbU (regulator of sigma subunit)